MTTAFVTVAQMETALQRQLVGTAAEEALDQACDIVREYLGAYSPDWVADDAVKLDGTDRATLLLPRLPVVAVGSVTVTTGGTPTTLAVDVDYAVDLESGILWHLTGRWPRGRRNVSVTGYDHGFENLANIPGSLRGVTISLASRLYSQHAAQPGRRFESLGASSYTNDSTFAEGLSKLEQSTLDRLRDRRVPAA